jgi:hypothetical protein
MPGSPTTPGRPGARTHAPVRVAFRDLKRVGARNKTPFAAQWLAYALPCRRFACTLTNAGARLRADVDRYSFIVSDSHRLLLAGLPAHSDRVSAFTRNLTGRHQLSACQIGLPLEARNRPAADQ